MVQPGGPEVVLYVGGEPLVLAEQDTEHDPATGAVGPACHGTLDPVPEDVAEAGETASPSDLAPARRLEHDPDSLTCKPRALVEAILLRPRLRDPDRCLQDGSTRWRAPDGENEQHTLADCLVPERTRHGDDSRRPLGRARGCDGDELCSARLADLVDEKARTKRVHAKRAPPEAEGCKRDTESHEPRDAVEHEHAPESAEHECHRRGKRHGNPDRESEPDADRPGEQGGPVKRDGVPHGVTRSRSCSIRVGPTPGTASRSSTDANGPCSAR